MGNTENNMKLTIKKHCVAVIENSGLSPLQHELLINPAPVRIADAPTGAGKTYAFQQGLIQKGQRILFIVPTRRLAQNIAGGLVNDLIKESGWTANIAEKKVAIWSSDEGTRLQESGVTNIRGFRIKQLQALDTTRPEMGEMIVAIPEVLSHLLVSRRLDKGHASMGVFDLLDAFDHIVFDEFHTIESRGFGLAALLATLAPHFGRAKMTLMSATPINIKPTLMQLGISADNIAELHEKITDVGRALHGDVELSLEDVPDMLQLIQQHIELIQQEVSAGRQIVIIYNALRDLRDHLHPLSQLFKTVGISANKVLSINSIDDSGGNGILSCGFHVGQKRNPDDFSILLATASVEMGVTFRDANVMLMESGFKPLNFLQRYGRAARRGQNGQVIVRLDKASKDRDSWLRELYDWVKQNEHTQQSIHDLSSLLSESSDRGTNYFGHLTNNAIYTTGLYWQVLIKHPSNHKHQKKHLFEHQSNSSKLIYTLIQDIQKLQAFDDYKKYCDEWLRRFYGQALQYRNIGKRVTVIEGNGRRIQVGQLWLERETNIIHSYPIQEDEQGHRFYQLPSDFDDYLLDDKNLAQRRITCYFPHTSQTEELIADTEFIKEWCKIIKDKRNMDTEFAWEDCPKAMQSAEKIVRLTGLIAGDESEIAHDCVL